MEQGGFYSAGLTSPVGCWGAGVLAHKLLRGNWELCLGSQMPFYFHLCVSKAEIPTWGGRPTGVAAGGSHILLAQC